MKTVSAARTAGWSHPTLSYTVFSEPQLLKAIGRDLRDLYEGLTTSSQPTDLVRLAMQIDERRGGDASTD